MVVMDARICYLTIFRRIKIFGSKIVKPKFGKNFELEEVMGVGSLSIISCNDVKLSNPS